MTQIPKILARVSQRCLHDNLFYLAKDPLPCRTLNVTLPGHTKCTLHEADEFIVRHLKRWGYRVEDERMPVQAFQPDPSVWYGLRKPLPDEPWYEASNLYAKKDGSELARELILILAHKDSQSWLDRAPGAYDNATGTVALLEIARVLRDYQPKRSILLLFCNEEHWPWTSVAAAQQIAATDLEIIAVLNLDSLGGRASEQAVQTPLRNVTRYSTPAGEKLADLMAALNTEYAIGLTQEKHYLAEPNDDDGSFIKAGIPAAVMVIGSSPYLEPNYHTVNDLPENVDLLTVELVTRLCLVTVLHLDTFGVSRLV